jgi:hypothetical protein
MPKQALRRPMPTLGALGLQSRQDQSKLLQVSRTEAIHSFDGFEATVLLAGGYHHASTWRERPFDSGGCLSALRLF